MIVENCLESLCLAVKLISFQETTRLYLERPMVSIFWSEKEKCLIRRVNPFVPVLLKWPRILWNRDVEGWWVWFVPVNHMAMLYHVYAKMNQKDQPYLHSQPRSRRAYLWLQGSNLCTMQIALLARTLGWYTTTMVVILYLKFFYETLPDIQWRSSQHNQNTSASPGSFHKSMPELGSQECKYLDPRDTSHVVDSCLEWVVVFDVGWLFGASRSFWISWENYDCCCWTTMAFYENLKILLLFRKSIFLRKIQYNYTYVKFEIFT